MNTSYEGQLRSEAYKDGIQANQDGLLRDDNPYPRKTDEYICWELGWMIEQEKHDRVI